MGRPLRSSNLQTVNSPGKRKLPSSSENTDSSSTDSKQSNAIKVNRKVLKDKTNKKSTPSPAKRTRLRARLPIPATDQEATLSTDDPAKPSQLSDSPAESVKINKRVCMVQKSNVGPQIDNRRKTRRAILTTNIKSSKHQLAAEEIDEDKDIPVETKKIFGDISEAKNLKPAGRYLKNTNVNFKDKSDSQVLPKTCSSELNKAPLKNKQTEVRASARTARTTSLKENDRDEESSSDGIEKKKIVIKKQFRRANKKEILQSINESSSSSSSDDESPVRKRPICHSNSTTPVKKAFQVSTFYGDSKPASPPKEKSSPAASEGKGPKVCVYKTAGIEKEKPLVIQPRTETERLALYEFEFDSNEEKSKKKKRKPRPTKPKKVTKKLPPPNKKQGIKKVKSPVHKVHDFLPLSSSTKTTCVPDNDLTKAPANITRAGLQMTDPHSKKPQAYVSQELVPVLEPPVKPTMPRKRRSLSLPKLKVSKPAAVSPVLIPEPPLLSLFDDDDNISPSTSNIPQQKFPKTTNSDPKSDVLIGPIRFEYEELAQARALVVRNSLTPKASHVPLKPVSSKSNSPSKADNSAYSLPSEDVTLPAAESSSDSCPSMPRLRQTSIRSFLQGKLDEENRIDDKGLFSTGTRSAVEDVPAIDEISDDDILNNQMISSTPQCPKKSRPPMTTFLSPVMSSPVLRVSPRSSPKKVLKTPEKVKHSPRKIAQPPVRASPRKLVASPKKDSPMPVPTRLSIGTLKSVLRANVKTAPPMLPFCEEELEVPEDCSSRQKVPVSPQKNFNKPARKSYERRVRKAPQFMALEEDDEEKEEEEEEERDNGLFEEMEGEVEEPDTLHLPRRNHHKKQKDPVDDKEYDAWASRFNSRLEELDNFSLEVE